MNFMFSEIKAYNKELSICTIFIEFGQVFQYLWQFECNLTTFWHIQIWSYQVTQDENLPFLFSKSYSLLNFTEFCEKKGKVPKFCGSAASLTEVIKKTV